MTMNDEPAEWRDKLIAILSRDGVSQVPNVSKAKRYLSGFGKILGWLSTMLLGAAAAIAVFAYPLFTLLPPETAASYMNMIVWIVLILVAWTVVPRMHRAAREVTQIKLGYQPIQVLREAKHAPALYLRSFHFDALSSAVPKWQEQLLNVAMPTAELNLVQMIWRHAPVLAIGRPGETTPPVGAVRFYVRQDIWKQTVEAVASLCPLIVWTTGQTEGLKWEIKHLRETLPPRKLLLWLHFNAGKFSAAERAAEWSKFRENYRDIFPKPLPDETAQARFVAFDDTWTPILIPGKGYRPSAWELIASWPSTYGLDPFLRKRLG
jgi:hypothetical protein